MRVNGKNFTIGADPEIFMGKDGKFISAHDAVPGDKNNPHLVNKGAVQVDGMALEFNIDPAENLDEFNENLDTVQNVLREMIGDKDFLHESSVYFNDEDIKDVPLMNLMLGCQPDFSAWAMDMFQPPNAAANMRTAGGHVHIGGLTCKEEGDWDHFLDMSRLTRIMDETLGVYSILWDHDDKRREMYGKAGCFRPKLYGMEYRTLSNKWIFDKKLVSFVYNSVKEGLELFLNTNYEPSTEIRDIIDGSHRDSSFFKNNHKAQLLGY